MVCPSISEYLTTPGGDSNTPLLSGWGAQGGKKIKIILHDSTDAKAPWLQNK